MLGRRLTRNLGNRKFARRPAPAAHLPFEGLEGRVLMAADPLAFVNKVQPLPYVLEFDAPVDGLHDKDGQDIGLTRVQVNKHGQAHDIKNLFVSDGSQFTTGAAENPTLTIVSLAIRQAEYIAAQMSAKTI